MAKLAKEFRSWDLDVRRRLFSAAMFSLKRVFGLLSMPRINITKSSSIQTLLDQELITRIPIFFFFFFFFFQRGNSDISRSMKLSLEDLKPSLSN